MIGDPVRVKFVELHGALVKEVWRPATICYVSKDGERIGVAYSDSSREMLERRSDRLLLLTKRPWPVGGLG